MELDGGGWHLVWKHSYTEVDPIITPDMYYHSNTYKPCIDLESGWCNIPQKAQFQPSEMMIVAYHDKSPIYAYKGTFNYNINHHWTGAYLLDPVKLVDICLSHGGVPPSPESRDIESRGMSFHKKPQNGHATDTDTIRNLKDDNRWNHCKLNVRQYGKVNQIQMTVAIFVR